MVRFPRSLGSVIAQNTKLDGDLFDRYCMAFEANIDISFVEEVFWKCRARGKHGYKWDLARFSEVAYQCLWDCVGWSYRHRLELDKFTFEFDSLNDKPLFLYDGKRMESKADLDKLLNE